MRKFLIHFVGVLFTLLCGLPVENLSAQELKVASFEPLPMDVTARSKVEVDNNDNPCALLRVVVAAEGIEIRGNMGRVGDYYNVNGKEGVVFWVDATGKQGKIVSIMESGRLQWSSDEKERTKLIGADNETDGAKNMEAVKKRKGWQSKYPAFKWCADLGEGWYLPAKEELKQIFGVKERVNGTLAEKGENYLTYYWSSTESSKKYEEMFCAWSVRMYDGDTDSNHKSYGNYVRAVATF